MAKTIIKTYFTNVVDATNINASDINDIQSLIEMANNYRRNARMGYARG